MAKPKINSDGKTITVRVPIAIRKRGGRKVVLAPDGKMADLLQLRCRKIDNVMIKAIARAFRWREMLENGTYSTVKEIAAKEQINESYVSRVLRLTLLAPEIVESIVDDRSHSPQMTLTTLLDRMPVSWRDQCAAVGR